MTETDNDLVTLDIGFDRFRAELIVARCQADGLNVQFLSMDENGLAPGRVSVMPHRLLVNGDQAQAARTHIDHIEGVDNTSPPELGRVAGWFYRLLGHSPSG